MSNGKLGMRSKQPIGNNDGSAISEYASVTPVGDVTVVAAAANLSDDLSSVTVGQNGYWTGGSRFMHISFAKDANDVAVYAFNYAFGQWQPLMQLGPAGFDAVELTEDGHYILDINGTDRVAFVSGGAPTSLKIAFNSF